MNTYSKIIYNRRKYELGLSQAELGWMVYGKDLTKLAAQQRVSRVETGEKILKEKERLAYERELGISLREELEPKSIEQEGDEEMKKTIQNMSTKLDVQFGNINQALREINKELGGFEKDMRNLKDYIGVIQNEVNVLKKASGQG